MLVTGSRVLLHLHSQAHSSNSGADVVTVLLRLILAFQPELSLFLPTPDQVSQSEFVPD